MEIAAGQEVTVRAGDTALFPPQGGGELRNDGQEITVVLAASAVAKVHQHLQDARRLRRAAEAQAS